MDIQEKIQSVIKEIEQAHEGENFTDFSGYGMANFEEVVETVMKYDNTNEFEVGYYQGAKFMGQELINYDNDQQELQACLSFALELLSEKEVEIYTKWTEADPKERKQIEESWEV